MAAPFKFGGRAPAVAEPVGLGPSVNITTREFSQISDMARNIFGLELRTGKEELVCARLGKHLRKGGFRSFAEYLEHVRADRSGASLTALIDALATNHTSFMRERAHFDFLTAQVLPKLVAKGRIAIWSAACSTGEEPYTLACVASEAMGGRVSDRISILATDISTKALSAAQAGIYTAERVRELPQPWVQKYFTPARDAAGGKGFQVRPEVKSMVRFNRVNLLEPAQQHTVFDVIFCRNVMIYFSSETQGKVVARLTGALEPGGYLFVGHAESLTAVQRNLKFVRAAVYQKPGGRG